MCVFACTAAQAGLNCYDLFKQDQKYRDAKDRPFSVLAYLGSKPASMDANTRTAQRRDLERRVTNVLQSYWKNLANQIDQIPPKVVLITCDEAIKADDLDVGDATNFANRNVLGVVWSATEGDKPSVVHVSIPQYKRKLTAGRDPMEVAWLHAAVAPSGADALGAELERQSIAQQTFLALGIGLISIDLSQWQMAKRSLCQVLANLKGATKETVRPAADDLERDLRLLVKQSIDEIERQAKAAKVDVMNNERINQACNTGGAS
ncbi:MAG: hypothetical protein EON92_19415 [Burkholderiales bacterium]|nr:MAG: hypothetical protein EON92_19415 [Burkholderiales bacterium]